MMTMENETNAITGTDLIAWGHRPGPNFSGLLAIAHEGRLRGMETDVIRSMLDSRLPPPAPPTRGLHHPRAACNRVWPFTAIFRPPTQTN